VEIMNRRGFLQILSALVATPVIAKLSMNSDLILPPAVKAVEVIEPKIVTSGAASYARANRIFCMPGMVHHLSDHVRDAALAVLPPGAHFQVRAVPMTAAEVAGVYDRQRTTNRGVAMLWVSESDVTPEDSEYQLLGRFMVPKRADIQPVIGYEQPGDQVLELPGNQESLIDVHAELERITGPTQEMIDARRRRILRGEW
jgi:hypothetical protein